MTVTAPPAATPPEAPPREVGAGGFPPARPARPGDPGGGGGGGSEVAVTGMWIALAPILMLFMAFASAYVVRQGLGGDWVRVPVPRLLWANTLALLASSAVLERARRKAGSGRSARPWLAATLGLGILFLAGQLAAWRELTARGVGIATTPYSSFFYLLTGAHGVHLAGGLVGLAAATLWPARGVRRLPQTVAIRVAAIYWHFMGLLWVGLFLLLLLWR